MDSAPLDHSSNPYARLLRDLIGIPLREQTLGTMHAGIAAAVLTDTQGAEAVTVTSGAPVNTIHTGLMAYEMDEAQRGPGGGPSGAAAISGAPSVLPDVRRDDRWPAFRDQAIAQGTLSCIAIPLGTRPGAWEGSISLYSTSPNALDRGTAERLMPQLLEVRHLLANLHEYTRAVTLINDLQKALVNRAVIEQAKGMIMARTGCSPDEAFHDLSITSQTTNVKLNDLAKEVVGARSPGLARTRSSASAVSPRPST